MKQLLNILFVLFTLSSSANDILVLERNFKHEALSPFISACSDTVLVADLNRALDLKGWFKIDSNGFAKPYTEDVYWLEFQIKTDSTQTVYLQNRYKLLEEYKLFLLKGEELVYSNDLGYSSASVVDKGSYAPSFHFSLEKDELYTGYIFINKTFSSSVLPFKIYSEDSYRTEMNKDYLNKGFVLGLFIFMLLSGLASFLIFIQHNFLYYVFYLIGLALVSFTANGVARYYIWGDNTILSTFGMYIGCCIAMWFLGKIIIDKLEVKKVFNWYNKVFVTLFILVCLLLLLAMFLFHFLDKPPLNLYKYSIPLSLCFPLLFLVICIHSYKRFRQKIALWLILIFAITLVYTVLFSLISLVKVNYSNLFNFNVLILYEGLAMLVVLNLDLFLAKKKQLVLQNDLIREKEKSNLNFIEGQHSERKNISQKLHDSSANRINQLKQYISSKYNDEQASLHLEELHAEIRNISHQLNPYSLKEDGLKKAIEQELFKLDDLYGDIIFTLRYTLNEEVLNEKGKINDLLFWTFSELVSNSLKHSKATEVQIEIYKKEKQIFLCVTDNGIGYDSESVQYNLGLRSILERASIMNGEFNANQIENKMKHEFSLPIE